MKTPLSNIFSIIAKSFRSMNRRSFLQNSTLAAAALAFQNTEEFFGKKSKISIQLYSVRDDIAKDVVGTLRALRSFGYKNVEGFGLENGKIFGKTMPEMKAILKGEGLKMPTCHSMLTDDLFEKGSAKAGDLLQKRLDDAAFLGVKRLIHPWMKPEDRTLENAKLVAERLNVAGEKAQKMGLKMGYHNHDFEFTTKGSDGRSMAEILYDETDSDKVALQLDLFWIVLANADPKAFFKKYAGRFELFHVKDMSKMNRNETIEIGDGSIDFQKIFDQDRLSGNVWKVVELEHYKTTPMKGAERALGGLKKLKL